MNPKPDDEKVVRRVNLLTRLDNAFFYGYVLIWFRPHFFNDLMYRHRRKIGEVLRLRKYLVRIIHAVCSTVFAFRLATGSYFPQMTTIKAHHGLISFYLVITYLVLRWLLPAKPAVYGDIVPPTPVRTYQNPFERAYEEVYEKGRRDGYYDGYSTGVSAGSCMRWR
jgi:hypothetical protein